MGTRTLVGTAILFLAVFAAGGSVYAISTRPLPLVKTARRIESHRVQRQAVGTHRF